MSERYTRVLSLPDNLYSAKAPVLISAGALLKDNQTEKVLVQLKITNLSESIITACKVCIEAFDPAGKRLAGLDNCTYLDISAARGESFGSKTPFYLPDYTTRKITVSVVEAVFSNGEIWQDTQSEWSPVPAPEKISTIFPDAEIARQYELDAGKDSEWVPMALGGIYRCTCGTINLSKYSLCSKCGRNFHNLISLLNEKDLATKKDARLKLEQERRIAQAKAQREKEERDAKSRKKKSKRVLTALAGVLCIGLVAAIIVTVVIPASKYRKAEGYFAGGAYDEAVSAFTELGAYKDSEMRALEAKNEKTYQQALTEVAANNIENAASLFESIIGYRDSAEQRAALSEALLLLQFKRSDVYNEIRTGAFEFSYFTPETSFNEADMVVQVDMTAVDGTAEHLKNIDSIWLDTWYTITSELQKLTSSIKKQIERAEYPYGCRITLKSDTDGSLLYSVTDGKVDYNYIDMDQEYESIMESIYEKIVVLVKDGQYTEARKYWEDTKGNYYKTDFKDISDFLRYSEAMENISDETLNQLLTNVNLLKGLPDGFLRRNQYLSKLQPIADTFGIIRGTYNGTGTGPLGGPLDFQLEVGSSLCRFSFQGTNGRVYENCSVQSYSFSDNSMTFYLNPPLGESGSLTATAIINKGECSSIKVQDNAKSKYVIGSKTSRSGTYYPAR